MIYEAIVPTFISEPEYILDFNKWLFENIRPYITGRTLEMNSGHGVMAATFVENALNIHLSESNQALRHELRDRLQDQKHIRLVHNIDFSSPNFDQLHLDLFSNFRTIIATNIAEYGLYDKLSLSNANKLLKTHGKLIVAIPSFTALFEDIDISLREWKRYNRKPIRQFLSGFKILKTIIFRYADPNIIQLNDQVGYYTLVIAQKIE